MSLILIGALKAQYTYKELVFIPWGQSDHQLQIKDVPGFKLGPTSFSVSQNRIHITDPISETRKSYFGNEFIGKEPISGLDRTNNSKKFYSRNVVREDDYTLRISGDGSSFTIIQPDVIGSGRYLGENADGLHYVYVESIIQNVPLDVIRIIGLYDANGAIKAIFQIPNIDYTYIEDPFYIDDEGHLYIMSTRSNGMTISCWLQQDNEWVDVPVYSLPNHLFDGLHYNTFPNQFPEPEPTENDERESYHFPIVTPDEALEIADTYVSYVWDADAGNITGGPIIDPHGVAVETPGWIQVGTNYHVPYQWGGFYSIDGFIDGIDDVKYAGDKVT
ncbi:MAG TPA: hypothetical protein QGH56_09260, partial [Candidatus Marinimicrobia bacterium]|nr:hypothetical protein [Candidatus Neomarinimicrobiota bacterium]